MAHLIIAGTIQDGAVVDYRVRLGISFKYDPKD